MGCIEMVVLPDETYRFNFISVKKKKQNKIEFIDEESTIDNFDTLKNSIDTKIPICLVINGKGIISKKVATDKDENIETLLQKVLPNALSSDFCVRSYPSDDSNNFVSLIRKSQLEKIVEEFIKNKIFIIDVFWGPFIVGSLIPLIGNTNSELSSENYKFTLHNQKITDYTTIDIPEKETFKIENENIHIQSMIALGGLIFHFFENNGINTSNIPCVVNCEKEFTYSRLFTKIGWSILVFMFSILLINFILFGYYDKEKQKLSGQVNQYNDLLINLDTLKKSIAQKQDLLESSGLSGSTKNSFYADRIASTIKTGITLTKLAVTPVEKTNNNNQNEEGYTFKKEYILINGTTNSSTYLNEWVKEMKKLKWVKEVIIKNYTQENNLKPAVFTIEIKIDTA